MQTIAQSGNGTAAYIDTLAEAEKVLVQDASSTLFPIAIAKDVKIQVEFNPRKVAEYRLIGCETRAFAREDFNNDRIDAGEIGSGRAVTVIYEITPKGSPATVNDGLRYGQANTDNASGVANVDENAFVKIRYKAPDGDVSKLITTPVTSASEVGSFDAASNDQRFSVAVAAFGQKLRGSDQVAGMNYDWIAEIATAARGTDPFGYRAEFLLLVRLATAMDDGNR
jgi:Ca-activated chloride channel homolog